MSMSERDKELLRMVGMSEQQAERNARQAESESEPDGLTGRVYYGLHLDQPDEEMVKVAIASVEAVFDWKAYLIETFGYTNEAFEEEEL